MLKPLWQNILNRWITVINKTYIKDFMVWKGGTDSNEDKNVLCWRLSSA